MAWCAANVTQAITEMWHGLLSRAMQTLVSAKVALRPMALLATSMACSTAKVVMMVSHSTKISIASVIFRTPKAPQANQPIAASLMDRQKAQPTHALVAGTLADKERLAWRQPVSACDARKLV